MSKFILNGISNWMDVQLMAITVNQLLFQHLPNISDDTGVLKMSPVNSHVVCLASIPEVPSKTWKGSKIPLINNGNKTEESPIHTSASQNRLTAKRESDLFNHKYDYIANWTKQSPVTN